MKFKIIKNYDRRKFSETELSLIDVINENPELFLSAFNLKEFCEKNNFSVSTIQKIAKKLNYKSANQMKSDIAKKYFKDISLNKKESLKKQNISIEEYLNKLEVALKTIDEELVNKLTKKILNCNYVYIYNSDQFFKSKIFDFFSSILPFKIYRIDNDYRLKIAKNLIKDKNSILIVTKVFSELTEFESKVINYFLKEKIEIYTISAVEGLFPKSKEINNIVIGNYKNLNNEDIKIIEFRIFYNNLINIIVFNLFLYIQKQMK
ncbi:MAG: hypothetical protein K2H56_00445 [Malacoplasma sp.]|nr:hypothetical protein [Malacoplasma sp.]